MTAPWHQTLGGKRFDLTRPRPEDVSFLEMARVLARVPRYSGHTKGGVLSVAQHCDEGARAIFRATGSRDLAGAFLLHDGHEYVMGDIAVPIRDAIMHYAVLERGDLDAGTVVKEAIRGLKRSLDDAIYAAAGMDVPTGSTARLIHEYDVRMLRTERDARLAPPPEPWGAEYENARPIAGADVSVWTEELAAARFYAACQDWLPCYFR